MSEQSTSPAPEVPAPPSITLSNFFDDIVMTSNNGKEKVECFGCSG